MGRQNERKERYWGGGRCPHTCFQLYLESGAGQPGSAPWVAAAAGPRPLLSPGGLGAPLILWFLGSWLDTTSSACPQGSVSVVNSEAHTPKDAPKIITAPGVL